MNDREKRHSPRIAATFKVEYESFDKFLLEYSEDISQGGIFLASELVLPLGTVVRLILHLPQARESVQVIGQVVHHRTAADAARMKKKTGMGVEFLDIDSAALRRVREFVDARALPHDVPTAGRSTKPRRAPVDAVIAIDDFAVAQAIVKALGDGFIEPRVVRDGMRALSESIRRTPSLIVAAADLSGMPGSDLLRVIRERSTLSAVPFVLIVPAQQLTEASRLTAFRAGVDDVVSWPVAGVELRARVERILARGASTGLGDRRALRGELRDVSIASLLGLLEMERKSGYLLMVREGETALVGLREGHIVRADVRAPDLVGRDKVFYVLDWTEGRFEFISQDVGTGDEVGTPTTHLLLEHARLRDEQRAGRT